MDEILNWLVIKWTEVEFFLNRGYATGGVIRGSKFPTRKSLKIQSPVINSDEIDREKLERIFKK